MSIQSLFCKQKIIYLFSFFILIVISIEAKALSEAGYVDYVRGVVTSQHGDVGTRILGKRAKIYEEDVITTANRSFAIIKLKDGSRITVRPNSSLGIEKYIARKNSSDSAVLSLFRGGIRAITGFISKKREDAFRIKTPVATIGIRGTEFDARLCSKDCGDESKRHKNNRRVKTDYVIGRVAFLRGQMSATDRHKKTRQIFTGGPLYEGDILKTGLSSFSVLAFKDKSRITLKADSVFEIKKHYYDAKKPGVGSALMVLFRGGLRAVSGLIGKKDKDHYQMRTPVATIGIRGTGYDIQCEGKCQSATPRALISPLEKIMNAFVKPVVAAVGRDGMYAHVWNGSIELNNKAGSRLLSKNQTAFLKNNNTAAVILPELPFFMRSTPAPRPDKVKVDAAMFSKNEIEKPEAGLYVSVYDGHVSMTDKQGNRVDLGKGETGFKAHNRQDKVLPVRLNAIPVFHSHDAYPRPESFNESWENLFNDVTNTDENQDLECVPK